MARKKYNNDRHGEGQTCLHCWLNREMKQLAQYLAALDNITMTEMAVEGIENRARRRNLLNDDGSIRNEIREEMIALDNLLKERAESRKNARIASRVKFATSQNNENRKGNE